MDALLRAKMDAQREQPAATEEIDVGLDGGTALEIEETAAGGGGGGGRAIGRAGWQAQSLASQGRRREHSAWPHKKLETSSGRAP